MEIRKELKNSGQKSDEVNLLTLKMERKRPKSHLLRPQTLSEDVVYIRFASKWESESRSRSGLDQLGAF